MDCDLMTVLRDLNVLIEDMEGDIQRHNDGPSFGPQEMKKISTTDSLSSLSDKGTPMESSSRLNVHDSFSRNHGVCKDPMTSRKDAMTLNDNLMTSHNNNNPIMSYNRTLASHSGPITFNNGSTVSDDETRDTQDIPISKDSLECINRKQPSFKNQGIHSTNSPFQRLESGCKTKVHHNNQDIMNAKKALENNKCNKSPLFKKKFPLKNKAPCLYLSAEHSPLSSLNYMTSTEFPSPPLKRHGNLLNNPQGKFEDYNLNLLHPDSARGAVEQRERKNSISPRLHLHDIERFDISVKCPDGSEFKAGVFKAWTAFQLAWKIAHVRAMEEKLGLVVEEFITDLNLVRTIEDHEVVYQIIKKWAPNTENTLVLSERVTKYDIISEPENYFPTEMLEVDQVTEEVIMKQNSRKMLQIVASIKAPDIKGWVYMKDFDKKNWCKYYMRMRNSIVCISESDASNMDDAKRIYSCNSCYLYRCLPKFNEVHEAPYIYTFCFVPEVVCSLEEIKCVSTNSERHMTGWISAYRFTKYGDQLQSNFKEAMMKEASLRRTNSTRQSLIFRRSFGDNSGNDDDKATIDFSGKNGRVVSARATNNKLNSVELSVPNIRHSTSLNLMGINSNTEKYNSNDKSSSNKMSKHSNKKEVDSDDLNNNSKNTPIREFESKLANTHYSDENSMNDLTEKSHENFEDNVWYHGKLTREQAMRRLRKHDSTEGLFLIRDSSSTYKTLVVSVVTKKGKIKHYQISKGVNHSGTVLFGIKHGPQFSSLQKLIEAYHSGPVEGLEFSLRKPCPEP